jgi:MFS family permease
MVANTTSQAGSGQAADIQLAAWRDLRFVVFAVGNLVNNIGDAIYAIVMPLLIYNLTHSLIEMSVLAALGPATLLLGPLFGAIADRHGPRALVVPGLAVQLAAALALNLVIAARSSVLAGLILLGALVQVGGAAYRQGWMAGVPAMFPDTPVRARGTLSSLYVSSTILGPMIAGVTIGWLGYLGLLWINLATFCAPIVVWMLGVHPPNVRRDSSRGGRLPLWREITQGWDVIRRSPQVLRFTLAVLPLEFVASAGLITLAIYYLRNHWQLGVGGVGAIFTALSVGALTGSLAVSERTRFRLRPVLAIGAIGAVACLLAMSLPLFAAFVVGLVLFFTLDSAISAAADMLLVKCLPHSALGRAAGISRLIHGVPLVAGPLTIPLIVDLVGARLTFVVLAGLALLSVILVLRNWANWDTTQSLASETHLPTFAHVRSCHACPNDVD